MPQSHAPRTIRIALAQIHRIIEWIDRARGAEADIVVFPELALTGYPPEDLLLKPSFIRDNLHHLQRIVATTRGIAAVIGFVDHGLDIYNAAAFAADGEVRSVYHKSKRRQAPPGIKITPRDFERDRRMPLTNRYVDSGLRRDG